MQAADAKIQEVADKVRPTLEKESGQVFQEYKAETFCSQVVAGLNYFIKVNVGGGKYVHLRVYQDLQQNVQLAGYQLDKEKDSSLTYF